MLETFLIIINLIILESLLSVDNATALAAMVRHLPETQRKKALRYGLFGAYFFRGLCLFIASWLITVPFLKILGGLYLCWLTFKYFYYKNDGDDTTKGVSKSFWGTVIAVELLDLSLSIDNVFAAVALSDSFWVIMVGVAIGILAMRFVAMWFVKLIDKYPTLEVSAYIVIALLGIKLIVSDVALLLHWDNFKAILDHHYFDLGFSVCLMFFFFVPLMRSKKQLANAPPTTIF